MEKEKKENNWKNLVQGEEEPKRKIYVEKEKIPSREREKRNEEEKGGKYFV